MFNKKMLALVAIAALCAGGTLTAASEASTASGDAAPLSIGLTLGFVPNGLVQNDFSDGGNTYQAGEPGQGHVLGLGLRGLYNPGIWGARLGFTYNMALESQDTSAKGASSNSKAPKMSGSYMNIPVSLIISPVNVKGVRGYAGWGLGYAMANINGKATGVDLDYSFGGVTTNFVVGAEAVLGNKISMSIEYLKTMGTGTGEVSGKPDPGARKNIASSLENDEFLLGVNLRI